MESFLRDGGTTIASISNKAMAGTTGGGDAHFFDDSTSSEKIRSYLISTKESEKLKGMKWLLAMLSKGRDVAEFFPDVVKNVVVKSVEKDMAGANQLIRGLALRVMTSIRVPDIIQIQLLAVRKCSTDSSPYVRRCAATAITKIFAFDPTQIVFLKQILEKLLQDNSTMVLGSALAAFNEVCPTSYDILHKVYRKICHLFADMEEWTQVSVLEVMTRYVRNHFSDPSPGSFAAVKFTAKRRSTAAVKGRHTVKRRVVRKAFYSDEEDESDEEEIEVPDEADEGDAKIERGSVFAGGLAETEGDLDPDHRLIMRSSLPLLKSRNSGVVLAVCSLHYYCGVSTGAVSTQIGKALVRILRNPREIQYVVLTCISTIAQERPLMFRPFLQDFLVKGTDPIFNRMLKLEILTAIVSKENVETILRECQTYARHGNKSFVRATVRAVGRVADAQPEKSDRCMEGILHLLYCNKVSEVVTEAVIVLRQLLQQNGASESGTRILNRLVKLLITENGIEETTARASIVWLVGEFHDTLSAVAPDILRLLAAGFADEEPETRVQILNLAIKQSLRLADNENVQSLMTYVLEMARYDPDTDIRDRARFCTALMGLAPSGEGDSAGIDEEALEEVSEHAKGIMLAPKLPPLTLLGPVDVDGLPNFTVGSLSSLVGHHVPGYDPVPQWPTVTPDLSLRDMKMKEGEDSTGSSIQLKSDDSSDDENDGKAKAPKGFYEDDEDEDDEEDEDDDDEDDDDEEEDDDEDEEEEEEEDDDEDDEEEEEEDDEEEEEEDDEDDDESSEDEYAVRIPITKSKPVASSTVQRSGIRKITPSQKNQSSSAAAPRDQFVSSNDSLLSLGEPTTTAFDQTNNLLVMDTLVPNPPPSDPLAFMGGDSPLLFSTPVANSGGGDKLSQILDSFDAASISPGPLSHSAGMSGMNMSQPMEMMGQPMGMNMNQPMGMMGQSMGMGQPMGMMNQPMGMNMNQPMGMMSQPMGMMQPMGMGQSSSGMAPVSSDFMGLQFIPPPVPTASTALQEVLSDSRQVLKQEMSGGLAVDMKFRHGFKSSSLPGATALVITMRNCSNQPIRRIRVTFPSEIKRVPVQLDEVASLAPSEEKSIFMEALFTGVRSPIKVEVRCDKGTYAASLALEPWSLLVPLSMTSADIRLARVSLGGFSEVVTSIALPAGLIPSEEQISARVRRMVNVSPAAGAGASEGELLFAGSVRKASGMGSTEDRILLGFLLAGPSTLRVQVNSDDALVSTSIVEGFKKHLITGW